MLTVRSQQGETVDALCNRVYGRTAAITELVLDANPGLAERGPVLPNGTQVQLPDAAASIQPTRQRVQLWT